MYKKRAEVDPLKQKIQSSLAEIEAKNNGVKKFWDDLGDAEPTKEQLKQVADDNRKIEEMEHQVKDMQDELAGYDSEAASQRRASGKGLPYGRREIEQVLSSGEAFVKSEQFQNWFKEVSVNGVLPSQQVRNSPAVDLKTLVTSSSTSAGALIVNDRTNIIDPGTSYRPLTIRDLITIGTTDSNLVEYVREKTHTNNADVISEATASGNGTGASPESAMLLEIVQEAVKTIGHHVSTVRHSINDAGQMMTLINNWLLYGLDEKEEFQIVDGPGTGNTFTGLFNTPNISTQAFDTSVIRTARKARTKVKTLGRTSATGYLMNPATWETFDLSLDNEQRYIFGGPAVLGSPKLWGLPVIESEAVPTSAAMVANFKLAFLWDRMQSAIYMSDSHQDYFTRGLIAIQAEKREAFGVLRPAAFVEFALS